MPQLLSIIIPAYNSEKYISNCIKSILNQKFSKKKYEIIIVNDTSKDKTLKICKKFKDKNQNIKIFNNKKNSGVSYSRNLGIKKALGKFVLFLDSDDELKKNSLKIINKIISNSSADLLISLDLKKDEKKIFEKSNILKKKNISALFNIINKRLHFKGHCWNYVLNKNFIKKYNIYFNKIRIFEDQIFISNVLCSVKKFHFYKYSFCKHNERFNSLSRSMDSVALNSSLVVVNEIIKIIKTKKLTKEKIFFLNSRIIFMLKNLKIYLLACSDRQLKSALTFILKNIDNFKFIKKNLIQLHNIKSKKKNDYLKNFLLFRKSAWDFINDFNLNKFSFIYIFGVGLLGRALSQIMQRNKSNIKAFIDNNKYFYKKKFLGLRVYNPKIIGKFKPKDLQKTLIIISHEHPIHKKKVFNQLKNYGLKDNNIKVMKWLKILR